MKLQSQTKTLLIALLVMSPLLASAADVVPCPSIDLVINRVDKLNTAKIDIYHKYFVSSNPFYGDNGHRLWSLGVTVDVQDYNTAMITARNRVAQVHAHSNKDAYFRMGGYSCGYITRNSTELVYLFSQET